MGKKHHPRLQPGDRTFSIALRGSWQRWADVLVIVKPYTVVARPHRAFRKAEGPERASVK
jgi:hypothetical protein